VAGQGNLANLMAQLIQPRTLKGFRDYLPALAIPRERLVDAAKEVFRSYGFAPIDTPALELTEVLLAKVDDGAEVRKQLYRFNDAGGRDVALRFDLTVPLARFVSQHVNELGTPFRRYHIGPVWRGENTQAGRYREFMQCDFDTIGSTDNAADVEIALVISDLLRALGFERFEVRVNNRRVLNGLLQEIGLPSEAATPVLRALDKLLKIGPEAVRDEMVREAGATIAQADAVIALAQTSGTNTEKLDALATRFAGNDAALEGVRNLRQLADTATTAGIPDGQIVIDLSICRGLDYYTGTVYETFLTDLPGIGSVCSGGRYDDLTGRYTKQSLPGVGASLGLDRLLAAMEQLNLIDQSVATAAPVLVTRLESDRLGEYQQVARLLRAQGIGVDVFPDTKKLGAQLAYAERKGFALALIAGSDEFANGTWKIKLLAAREEREVPSNDLIGAVEALLAGLAV
jgi:histidyl-tRNA synthetase